MNTKRILLAGGGTGGHVYPLIAVAKALQDQANQKGLTLEILAIGEGPFMARATAEAGLKYKKILAGKLRRYFSLFTLIDILKFPFGLIQSLWHLYWFMPDAVFAKGGAPTIAPAIAAKLYFIPLYIHESDSVPGLANRLLGKLAARVFISFESASPYFKHRKLSLTGNPVRPELLTGNRAVATQTFGLASDRPTILVAGGSQGAKRINDIILESLAILVSKFQIIHQCGESQIGAVKSEVDKLIKEGQGSYGDLIKNYYHLYPFFNSSELAQAYAAADIIVSRAGAANIYEIAALGRPAVLIPIQNSPGDHQLNNAMEFSKFGAQVIEEHNLTPHILMNQIEFLLRPEQYQKVGESIKQFAKPEAADRITQAILS